MSPLEWFLAMSPMGLGRVKTLTREVGRDRQSGGVSGGVLTEPPFETVSHSQVPLWTCSALSERLHACLRFVDFRHASAAHQNDVKLENAIARSGWCRLSCYQKFGSLADSKRGSTAFSGSPGKYIWVIRRSNLPCTSK
jgi:hypothetical protein